MASSYCVLTTSCFPMRSSFCSDSLFVSMSMMLKHLHISLHLPVQQVYHLSHRLIYNIIASGNPSLLYSCYSKLIFIFHSLTSMSASGTQLSSPSYSFIGLVCQHVTPIPKFTNAPNCIISHVHCCKVHIIIIII